MDAHMDAELGGNHRWVPVPTAEAGTRFNVDVDVQSRRRPGGTPVVLLLPVALLGPCLPPPFT
jgi:hypothetical protein